MKFEDVREVLASHGLAGIDAETAFASWQSSPRGADGGRVQVILEREGLA